MNNQILEVIATFLIIGIALISSWIYFIFCGEDS